MLDHVEAPAPGFLTGSSAIIRELERAARRAAEADSTVLVTGETGTGKGVLARMLHAGSPRRPGPFVHVDCAALSPTLIESELFGHEKGAFTGAATTRRGRLELAGAGTLFLDEIGDLDLPLQSKLLRVLEDRTFERVGGTRSLRMTARVIAATSRQLEREVRCGRFREDLFYRLNVLRLRIPPLRDRLEDVPSLAELAVLRLSARLGITAPRVTQGFHARLRSYDWPGNVRELLNLIERVLVQHGGSALDGESVDALLDPMPRVAFEASRSPLALPDEAELIREALVDSGGNIARAARRLSVPRGTLRYRIRKYGLAELIARD